MAQTILMPMFPLTLLPLPGELVPLHIFEPRYKTMLKEAEILDIPFGIYFCHEINTTKVGSLVKLETVLKKYPNGESDIVVRCLDIFNLGELYKTYMDKPYPGGNITQWNLAVEELPSGKLVALYSHYKLLRKPKAQFDPANIFQIANELNLDLSDRYKFLTASSKAREAILLARLKFLIHAIEIEFKSRDLYHLN